MQEGIALCLVFDPEEREQEFYDACLVWSEEELKSRLTYLVRASPTFTAILGARIQYLTARNMELNECTDYFVRFTVHSLA